MNAYRDNRVFESDKKTYTYLKLKIMKNVEENSAVFEVLLSSEICIRCSNKENYIQLP